jgi:hypothetical protein
MREQGHKQQILDYVSTHPGALSSHIQQQYKSMPAGTISGRLSKFVADGTLTRVGEAGAYRYYRAGEKIDQQLPLAEPRRRRRARKSNGNGSTKAGIAVLMHDPICT